MMKILLTGANGYIGSRLMLRLLDAGHQVVALVRSRGRIEVPAGVEVVEGDLLDRPSLDAIPRDIEAAYYLVHSMSAERGDFASLEARCAENFADWIGTTEAKRVIYLSGLTHSPTSQHMASRRRVEEILARSSVPSITLRAGIIIGSGSASFEIIRDLVEKLPVMVTPKWVRNRCQPIAIRDVLFYLEAALSIPSGTYEIGGPDVLTYQQMLLKLAEVRGLKRLILGVPVLTPKLSSYWLWFVTSTNFSLAQALVESLNSEAICQECSIQDVCSHDCLTYEEAIKLAFARIEQNEVVSSWKDALVTSGLPPHLHEYIQVPKFGVLSDVEREALAGDRNEAIDRLWRIGGGNGWYYMDWAWTVRGWIDQLFGGQGLRRGRGHPTRLRNGDALDFWRVLVADREKGHLLLYAEMRLPGEAWLDFQIDEKKVVQTASFRPKGLLGRLYWYAMMPFHYFIFRGLCRRIARGK
jgi:uncharacterized protein YbjT (DUF2867 family)